MNMSGQWAICGLKAFPGSYLLSVQELLTYRHQIDSENRKSVDIFFFCHKQTFLSLSPVPSWVTDSQC